MNSMPNESIWGTINTCIEIALDVYLIVSRNEDGTEQTGVMAHQDAVPGRLSEQAAGMAQKEGEWYYFDENTKDIPMYEALQQKLAYYRRLEAETMEELEDIKETGRNFLTGYFGACPPPMEAGQDAFQCHEVRSGIYFVEELETGSMSLAIHKSVAGYMTAAAVACGYDSGDGEYLQYSMKGCAVPINELKDVFPEVEGLVISPDSLKATLCRDFGDYLAEYNRLVPVEKRIPPTDAPVDLFLSMQLEQESVRDGLESGMGPEALAEGEDYGEQVEYGVER